MTCPQGRADRGRRRARQRPRHRLRDRLEQVGGGRGHAVPVALGHDLAAMQHQEAVGAGGVEQLGDGHRAAARAFEDDPAQVALMALEFGRARLAAADAGGGDDLADVLEAPAKVRRRRPVLKLDEARRVGREALHQFGIRHGRGCYPTLRRAAAKGGGAQHEREQPWRPDQHGGSRRPPGHRDATPSRPAPARRRRRSWAVASETPSQRLAIWSRARSARTAGAAGKGTRA